MTPLKETKTCTDITNPPPLPSSQCTTNKLGHFCCCCCFISMRKLDTVTLILLLFIIVISSLMFRVYIIGNEMQRIEHELQNCLTIESYYHTINQHKSNSLSRTMGIQ